MSYLEDVDFDLVEELRAPLFRDWGIHFKHQDEMQKAVQSFERSIEANPEIYKSLLEHGICKLKMHRPDEALKSAKKCLELFPDSIEAKHVYENSVYELNRLEDALKKAHNTLHEHPKDHLGDIFINTVRFNLERAASQAARPLLRNLKYKLLTEKADKDDVKDDASEWAKSSTPKEDCDVTSLCGDARENLSPLERTHKETVKAKRHEIYFDPMVRDQILFWEKLKKHKALHLTQSPHSCKILTDIIDRCLKRTQEYERMLYIREPLYVKRATEKGHPKNSRLVALYYMQQNTRREAFTQLDKFNVMIETNIVDAVAYVEKIMIEFYAVKSKAVFPRKYEFMCEFFNRIGIHILGIFQVIPPNLMDSSIDERLNVLMRTPIFKNTSASAPIVKDKDFTRFGELSTFVDADAVDQTEIIFDKRIQYFLRRISCSRDAIEKAYLNHMLSELYMNRNRMEESQDYARMVVAEAIRCKSTIWKFIGYLNIVRADTLKRNYIRVERNLNELAKLAPKLSKYLDHFVRTAKRSTEDIELRRARISRMSRASRVSRMTFTPHQFALANRHASHL